MTNPPPVLGRRFVVVWAGQSLSAVGSVLSGVGVAIYVFVETGNAAWLGALGAVSSAPYLLTAPLLPLTDRFARRTTMIVADCLAVVGPAIAFAFAVAGRLEIWHLVMAGFLGGVGTSFQFPAWQASIPALVGDDALGRANGLAQLGPAVGIVLGPALATPMVAWWGIEAVLLVDLVTFAVAVGATALTPFADARTGPPVRDDGSWRSLWTWLRADGRPLIVLLVVMAGVNFLLAFFNLGLIVLATELGGIARAGLAMGFGGAAMIAGSLVSARRGVSADRIGTFARGMLLTGAGFLLAAAYPSLMLVIVGVVVALAAVPSVNAAVSTVFHERVPASMHGRMFGLRTSLGRSLEPVGALVAGVVIAHVAEPAVAERGVLAGSVGAIIGTGPGRGAALVLATVAVALLVAGVWLGRSWVRTALATPVSKPLPDPEPLVGTG